MPHDLATGQRPQVQTLDAPHHTTAPAAAQKASASAAHSCCGHEQGHEPAAYGIDQEISTCRGIAACISAGPARPGLARPDLNLHPELAYTLGDPCSPVIRCSFASCSPYGTARL